MKKEKLFSITKKDLEIQTFCSGGPGGQHQNKTASGVRIIHRASGAAGESRTEKSQYRNKRLALKRLAESQKFKLWVNRMAHEITDGETLEQKVDRLMSPGNIKVEVRDDTGKWAATD